MYDKASLALIPSGTKTSKLYSVLPSNGNGDFDFSRSLTTATRVNKDGLIESVAADAPRLDYTGNVDCPHLLLEPNRTNSLLYSNLFTWSGWSKGGAGTGSVPTVTGNYSISPDGSQNASRLQLDKGSGTTTSDYSFMYETVTSVGTGSISIWMKSNDSNTYQVALRESNFIVCDVTPEWQRFELNNQAFVNEIQIILRGTYGTSNNADILIYGAQLEAGSYTTSYIPTSGGAETRTADICNNAGTSAEFNVTEGVLFAEIKGLVDVDASNRYISLTDGTVANSVMIQYRNSGELRLYNGGTSSSNMIFRDASADLTQNKKIAIKYGSSTSNYKVFINGVEKTVDSGFSASALTALDEIKFTYVTSGNGWYGNVKQLIYFNEALSDSELQTLTS